MVSKFLYNYNQLCIILVVGIEMWLCFMNLLREPGIRFHPDPFPLNY